MATDGDPWIDPELWRACSVAAEEASEQPVLRSVVYDSELGCLVAVELPDGRVVYGVDTPPNAATAATNRPARY